MSENINQEIEQKLAYLKQEQERLKNLEASLKSSMKNLMREKNKKPIESSIHQAASSGKFSIKVERGNLKYYLQSEVVSYILNHAEDMKRLIAECDKLNTDKELSQTNKVA